MRLPPHNVECSIEHYGPGHPHLEHTIGDMDPDWVHPGDKAKALSEGSFWVMRWYPDNLVGSYCIAAHSLANLLSYLEGSESMEDYA